MVRENHVRVEDLIYPMFVMFGEKKKVEVSSMPGIYNYSLDEYLIALKEVVKCGIPAILLFGIPETKDEVGSGAYHQHGIVQEAVRLAKKHYPELYVITDVCLCEYTDHGHCGVIQEGQVLNDPTLDLLAQTAVSHAQAGADMVAPSDMMDGRVGAIRKALDQAGYTEVPIMSYSAKFASGYYGPFRDAAGSTPQFGDRRTYQMDPPNGNEAMIETALDIEEGADIIIVKPALVYGDIIYRTKQRFGLPVAAYNVSGEYAMVKAAAANGWIDEERIVMETLVSMKRAGADLVITYHALDVARWLQKGEK
jgi:porphobilinogen synthase